jgi:predicted GH43/DUF377 family glycosyl hydrolase
MFVKQILDAGGAIYPLLLSFDKTNGTGIFNPSIYYDKEFDKLYLNIRHCQVTLYHAEYDYFESYWGPLHYCHPENDCTLTTTNYFGELNTNSFDYNYITKVDTSLLDVKPIWSFVGLEDCRVVKWNNKIYVSGVRRDTTTNGQGRIELSELSIENGTVKEIARNRLQPPGPSESYCEKNWMPVVDKEFEYVKWCNPTEVVKADLATNTTTQTYLGESFWYPRDFRGGSQVIRLNESYRFACVHTVNLYKSEQGRKNAIYRHCFIVWDNNWNLVKHTTEFSFFDHKIEFCAGMTKHKDNFLLTFGLQDNGSYILSIPQKTMEEICLK